jgi:hypothetical protein
MPYFIFYLNYSDGKFLNFLKWVFKFIIFFFTNFFFHKIFLKMNYFFKFNLLFRFLLFDISNSITLISNNKLIYFEF